MGANYVDDSGVFRLDGVTLVQSVDFFTPIVDDPFSFGQIAAANSLSDIYAMGGTPILAMNVVCFPTSRLGPEILGEILRGGIEKLNEAGVVLLGGHTVEDKEPKYGLAVTGVIDPDRIITLSQARSGDILILTKPLGIGIITTAHKMGKVKKKLLNEAIRVMSALNDEASRTMLSLGASACTDITGYGLLGHALKMAQESGVTLRFFSEAIPVLPGINDLLSEGYYPGGSSANLSFVEGKVRWGKGVSFDQMRILCDAQTSGGLLFSIPREVSREFEERARCKRLDYCRVGEVLEKGEYPLLVE